MFEKIGRADSPDARRLAKQRRAEVEHLLAAGIYEGRTPSAVTLRQHCDDYYEAHASNLRSADRFKQCLNNVCARLGDKLLSSLTL